MLSQLRAEILSVKERALSGVCNKLLRIFWSLFPLLRFVFDAQYLSAQLTQRKISYIYGKLKLRRVQNCRTF